jgi:SOS response regulatory protein OraA/RecX
MITLDNLRPKKHIERQTQKKKPGFPSQWALKVPEMEKLVRKGYSTKEMADHFGVSRGAMRVAMSTHKVSMKKIQARM